MEQHFHTIKGYYSYEIQTPITQQYADLESEVNY